MPPRRAGFIALLALLALPYGAGAQEPKIDETHATLNWIVGRWRMPVTCVRADGSRVHIEEAVVFRPAPEDADGRTLRATFFGIDVADAVRCYNLIEKNVPDRRGVLILTYLSHGRPDIGLANLRKNLAEQRALTYSIRRGTLQVRQLGSDAAPERLELAGSGTDLTVSLIAPGSDGDKLLGPLAKKSGDASLRRLRFELAGDGIPGQHGYYLEDGERRPGQRR